MQSGSPRLGEEGQDGGPCPRPVRHTPASMPTLVSGEPALRRPIPHRCACGEQCAEPHWGESGMPGQTPHDVPHTPARPDACICLPLTCMCRSAPHALNASPCAQLPRSPALSPSRSRLPTSGTPGRWSGAWTAPCCGSWTTTPARAASSSTPSREMARRSAGEQELLQSR